MTPEKRITAGSTATAGKEFSRRYCNLLCELQLQPGIHHRIERLMSEFAEEHPNLRAAYLSRTVDESYFADGAYGWEAAARPKLQGIAIEGENLFEFIAFANGIRRHSTPFKTVVNVEEMWLESAPDQPFLLRVCLYHDFPATTILSATDADTQEAALAFISRLKYLRGL